MSRRTEEKRVALVAEAGLWLEADNDLLRRLIENVVDNAVC